MTTPNRLIAVGLCGALLGCSDDSELKRAPNTSVEGTVKEVRVQTRTSKLFGEVSKFYQIVLVADGATNWYGNVGASRVSEDDLRRMIGDTASFSCFRDHSYTTCHNLLSLRHQGRELLKDAR